MSPVLPARTASLPRDSPTGRLEACERAALSLVAQLVMLLMVVIAMLVIVVIMSVPVVVMVG